MDVTPTFTMVGLVIGVAVVLAILILVGLVVKRKLSKKEVTTIGTDKSDFAKMLMDELHEERNKEVG